MEIFEDFQSNSGIISQQFWRKCLAIDDLEGPKYDYAAIL